MGRKLEKKCRPNELKLGCRYSLTETLIPDYTFVVIEVADTYVRFQYFDKTKKTGMAYFYDNYSVFYEFPLSPLELELL